MPDGVRGEYDSIDRSEIGAAPARTKQPHSDDDDRGLVRKEARDWAVNILTAATLALVVVTIVAVRTVLGFRASLSEIQVEQRETTARACAFYAIDGTYFPSTCFKPEIMDLYARDVIDSLDTDGFQGSNRRAICDRLLEQDVPDEDCILLQAGG